MALGRIAYWAAWVESTLGWVSLGLLQDLGPAGKAITNGRTAGQLIELCRGLLDAGHPEPDGMREVLSQVKAALENRNRILHSAIGGALVKPGEAESVVLWGRKGTSRVVPESEFDAVAEELFQANMALSNYLWLT